MKERNSDPGRFLPDLRRFHALSPLLQMTAIRHMRSRRRTRPPFAKCYRGTPPRRRAHSETSADQRNAAPHGEIRPCLLCCSYQPPPWRRSPLSPHWARLAALTGQRRAFRPAPLTAALTGRSRHWAAPCSALGMPPCPPCSALGTARCPAARHAPLNIHRPARRGQQRSPPACRIQRPGALYHYFSLYPHYRKPIVNCPRGALPPEYGRLGHLLGTISLCFRCLPHGIM